MKVDAQVERTGFGQSLSVLQGCMVRQTPSSAVTSVRRQSRSLRPHGPVSDVVSAGLQEARRACPCTHCEPSSSDIGSPHDCAQKSVPSSWLAGKQVIGSPVWRSAPQRGSRAAVSHSNTRDWKSASSTEQERAVAATASVDRLDSASSRALAVT
jgi:hypothetical protein